MTAFPHDVGDPVGRRATLGLIVLQVDQTIEADFRRLFPDPDVALHVSRVPSGADLTPETIATMETMLPEAVALLPPAAAFDVVAYACTSGTTLIGQGRVAQLVRANSSARAVTDPLSAALAAFGAEGVRSPAIVSPYVETVAVPIRDAFEAGGLRVPLSVSFDEQSEARVARIDPASTRAAALSVGAAPEVDGVFLSCTNLQTLDIIDDLRTTLGKPVLSSNLALAWHMARLAGGLPMNGAAGRCLPPPA